MRRLVWVVCLAGLATATAGPLERKPATANMKPAALSALINSIVSEREGDLNGAANGYTSTLELDENNAAAAFDLAALSLVLEHIPGAIKGFRRYLELAPNAPDRAEIERLLEQIENADPVITFGGQVTGADDDVDALILLDGVVVGASPITKTLAPGEYLAERITRTTYRSSVVAVKPGGRGYVDLDATANGGGNVLLSGFNIGVWREGKLRFAAGERFTLPIGHYSTTGKKPGLQLCAPVSFDVRSEQELTYVHITGQLRERCFEVDKVTVQLLKVSKL